jgi:hypothetical protein
MYFIVTYKPIARQRSQYTYVTIEQVLQEVFSMWARAMLIAMQRLIVHVPVNTQQ